MSRHSPFLLTVVGLVLAGAAAGAITLVSIEEEIAIGKEVDRQVRGQVRVLRDREVTAYVRDIGRRLVSSAPGPKYPYSFAVADTRAINAFALPGGPVWINRGVLRAATNEAEVASVLAHEIAHIAQRHAATQLTHTMVARWGLGFLGAVLGNSGGAAGAQAAAGLLTNGIFLKFSRDDEQEADRVGLRILARAGWDARGMLQMFETLRREAGRDPGTVELFLSSHPSPQDRIGHLRSEVRRLSGGRRDSVRFRTIRARLRR